MEERLKEGLRLLADEAPPFTGIGAGRPRRWVKPVAAAAVLAAVAGTAYVVTRPEPATPTADCEAILKFGGRSYTGLGGLYRTPKPGERLGTGVQPGCDDQGKGPGPSTSTEVYRLPGVDPAVGLVTGAGVWLAAASPPALVRLARTPPPCELEGSTSLVGSWISVRSAREPQFDGDVTKPFRFEFTTSDPRLVGTMWESVTIKARSGPDLEVPGVPEIDRMLLRGEEARVTVRCQGERWVADELRPAQR